MPDAHMPFFLAVQDSQPALQAPVESEVPGTPSATGTQQPAGAAPGPGAGGAGTQGTPPSSLFHPFNLIILVVFMMLLMTMMGGRKERRRRAEMLKSLKKHDRVQTSGGIIGTITEIKDDEVTLRVDEGSNTRIRFARSAIVSVLRAAAGREETDAKPDAREVENANA